MIPFVIGVLGTVTKELVQGLKDLEIRGREETIQTTALLRSARILRRVLEIFGSFLSNCWVAFGRPFYLWVVLLGVPQHWRVPPALGGHPPGFYSLRGVRFIAWRLRHPKKKNTDGVEGIFGLVGRVWASALRLDPP